MSLMSCSSEVDLASCQSPSGDCYTLICLISAKNLHGKFDTWSSISFSIIFWGGVACFAPSCESTRAVPHPFSTTSLFYSRSFISLNAYSPQQQQFGKKQAEQKVLATLQTKAAEVTYI